MEPMLSLNAAVHRDWVDLLVFPRRPITSERWLIAGFGVIYTSACALVMSTYHEVLDVSSTIHLFALILLWCKVMLRVWFCSEWIICCCSFANETGTGRLPQRSHCDLCAVLTLGFG